MMLSNIFKKYFLIDDPVDRFNFPQESLFKIPVFNNNKITLEYCIKKQVEIINKYENIYLLWSGGIDSTLAFYSLLSYDVKFHVIMTENSKLEYPSLFKKISNNEFNNVTFSIVKTIDEVLLKEDYCLVTGECGDQLVGSIVYLNIPISKLKLYYKDYIPEDFLNITEKTVLDFFSIIDKNNTNITVVEYYWCINFIYKYDNVNIRIKNEFKKKYSKEFNFIHFFNTEDFQLWSMQNYKINTNFNDLKQYKIEYKKYIYSINKDENYLLNKKKVGSLGPSGLIF